MDVDGSYLYRKQQSLKQSGIQAAPLPPPAPPLAGWEVVTDDNVNTVAVNIPIVTSGEYCTLFQIILTCIKFSGTLYTYLACGTGRSPMQGTFRALTRGYNHWASGRLHHVQVNSLHPQFCHVRATCIPSMKPGNYHVYLLLVRDGAVATVHTATCECAAG